MNYLKWKQQHKKNQQEQKHKTQNQNTLLTNIDKRNTRIGGKTTFFHKLKARQETRQKQKHKTKTTNTKNKANIETERLKHSSWKQKHEQQDKIKQRKMKATWASKRGR